jgi:hypothetical protein
LYFFERIQPTCAHQTEPEIGEWISSSVSEWRW